ncbi:hypothetical protein FEM48_Zijuj11G0135400 [Ziziphus jujuba var. spinosa]|uniref:DUF4220 domain-containing protein n=1 Tax=Ziziphus jujuba var. spinosa TaxID=714518 RepID=A0A978UJ80_ZIZJJ|nr:hypothetical protein FEM48_Zijuj11G0135400 [Ziziphus jujuba var. spinosa]
MSTASLFLLKSKSFPDCTLKASSSSPSNLLELPISSDFSTSITSSAPSKICLSPLIVSAPVYNSLNLENASSTSVDVAYLPVILASQNLPDIKLDVVLSEPYLHNSNPSSRMVFLVLFSSFRQRSKNSFLQFLIWSTYLYADWIAAVTVRLITEVLTEPFHDPYHVNEDLYAFWASFLLLHLGGPDTITAFALEHNEFWLRHLFGLILQVFLVLFSSFRQRSKNSFLQFLIWSTYLYADWIAAVTVRLITEVLTEPFHDPYHVNEDLYAFWASFLLLHLGGPDTITAFALEHNEFWLRHLFGLILQVFLVLFSSFRQRSKNSFLQFLIWSTYLYADWIAAVTVRLITEVLTEPFHDPYHVNEDLYAFWASFLLLHLGGPDTITAFALEHNEFWLRHLFGLILQFENTVGDFEDPNAQPESEMVTECNFNLASKSNHMELLMVSYSLFKSFKGIILGYALSSKLVESSTKLFLHIKDPNVGFKLIEYQVSFMYDVFHTKATAYNMIDYCLDERWLWKLNLPDCVRVLVDNIKIMLFSSSTDNIEDLKRFIFKNGEKLHGKKIDWSWQFFGQHWMEFTDLDNEFRYTEEVLRLHLLSDHTKACNELIDYNEKEKDRSETVLSCACLRAQSRLEQENNYWKDLSDEWLLGLCFGALRNRPMLQAEQASKGGELLTFIWVLLHHLVEDEKLGGEEDS